MIFTNKVLNSLRILSNNTGRIPLTRIVKESSRLLSSQQVQYNVVEPVYPISYPKRVFPDSIAQPHYAVDGKPRKHSTANMVKEIAHIKRIAESCRVAKTICMTVGGQVKPGMTCEQIDDLVFELCLKNECYPSPLNYSGYPKCVTTSVNNIAVHAIPDQRALESGDIVSIDVSVFKNGFHGDCCHTFTVGECDTQAKHLMNVAELCLYEAIKICKAGVKIREIGATIERIAKDYDMGVIPEFCGHGVGHDLHESPPIVHYKQASNEQVMWENMVFTIEPIITESVDTELTFYDDGWTVGTQDFSRSAQYEHTIWIRKDGPVILTHID